MKLRVYRNLGVEVERDEEGSGEVRRAVVRSKRRGEVEVVRIDPKFDRFFYANLFWDAM